MTADHTLKEMLGEWEPRLPVCERHPDATVAGFCTECGKPACGECAVLSSAGLRCVQCVPPWQTKMSPGVREAAGALYAFFASRRTLAALAGLAAFAAALAFFPAILRPSSYEAPRALVRTNLRAPYLEKAFRLRIAGDTISKAGRPAEAQDYYRRAADACRLYLDGGVPADQEPIVRLGLGRLLERQGEADKAIEMFSTVIAKETNSAPAGVAAYYLGRLLETAKSDPRTALARYREAYAMATRGGAESALFDYGVAEQDRSTCAYAVAALLDTATHPRAYGPKIAKAIERLTGVSPDADPEKPRTVESEEAETLEIILGR